MKRALAGALLAALPACGAGETGGEIVSFSAYASGLPGVAGTAELETGAGFHVSLTKASLHIGAVYLRLGQTNPGSANASCVGDTTYGVQVPGPIDVDVLSAEPQPFSYPGAATTDLDQSGEIWLVDGDINRVASTAVIVSVAGTAAKDGATHAFAATMTIGQNRLVAPANPAAPGTNPICKQRIVAPIPVSLQPSVGGHLLLQIDPAAWFADVDFATLVPGDDGSTLVIPDTGSGSGPDVAAGRAFFAGVTGASADTYRFSWIAP